MIAIFNWNIWKNRNADGFLEIIFNEFNGMSSVFRMRSEMNAIRKESLQGSGAVENVKWSSPVRAVKLNYDGFFVLLFSTRVLVLL